MDNIARSLISGLLSRLGIPEGTGHYEENFHKVIKNCSLDLSNPRINKAAVDLLLEGEFEYAYFQVLFNSVIPEGPAEEFMEGSVKFRIDEDHYGHMSYDLWLYDKQTLLKKKDPVWVYQNYDDVEEFMSKSWEPYLKVQQIIDSINSL